MPAPPLLPPAARDAILDWYDQHGRALSFRGSKDPYAVLVSEAMAQQTQAARAGEAWPGFIARFPTVATLAAATPADVLRAWHGLGYNRRALNLWRAARVIVEQHEGRVPSDLAALQALPGVGPYTARAIAAIAFSQPVGAVDTNVRRVLGRIVGGDAGGITSAGMQALADAAVFADRAADWTHAVMDVGAMRCRPQRPDCGDCPAQPWCRFAAERASALLNPAAPPEASGRAGGGTRQQRPERFPATSRWLRGQIVERLREVNDDAWTMVVGPIGGHGDEAVAEALTAMGREGLVELDPIQDTGIGRRARLPTS